MRLAFLGLLDRPVEEHHVEPCERAHIGDAGSHEARADDADLLEMRRGHRRRAPGSLVQFAHRQEQGPDHRSGFLRAQDMREIAAFDPQRRVHRKLQAFEHGLQQMPSPRGSCHSSRAGRWRSQAAKSACRRLRTPCPKAGRTWDRPRAARPCRPRRSISWRWRPPPRASRGYGRGPCLSRLAGGSALP